VWEEIRVTELTQALAALSAVQVRSFSPGAGGQAAELQHPWRAADPRSFEQLLLDQAVAP